MSSVLFCSDWQYALTFTFTSYCYFCSQTSYLTQLWSVFLYHCECRVSVASHMVPHRRAYWGIYTGVCHIATLPFYCQHVLTSVSSINRLYTNIQLKAILCITKVSKVLHWLSPMGSFKLKIHLNMFDSSMPLVSCSSRLWHLACPHISTYIFIHRIHRRQHVADDAGISKHRLSPYYAYYHNDSL